MLIPPITELSDSSGSAGSGLSTHESPELYQSRHRSIQITYVLSILVSLGFSSNLTSCFGFVSVIYPEAHDYISSIAIAAYSLAQFLMYPIIVLFAAYFGGNWAMYLGITCHVLGSLLWAYLQDMSPISGYSIIIPRFIVGLGAANITVFHSYIFKATTLKERRGFSVFTFGSHSLGLGIGFWLQALMSPLGYPGPLEVRGFHFNMYTGPAWICVFLGVFSFIIVIFLYNEHEIPDDPDDDVSNEKRVAPTVPYPLLLPKPCDRLSDNVSLDDIVIMPDYLILGFIGLWFFVCNIITVMLEATSMPLLIYEFNWNKQQVTLYSNLYWGIVSFVAVIVVFFTRMPYLRVTERILLVVSSTIFVIALWIHTPIIGGNLKIKASEANIDARGCPLDMTWCVYTRKIHLSQWVIALLFFAFAQPLLHVNLVTAFIRAMGTLHKNSWMSVLLATGSLANIVGPVYGQWLLNDGGPLVFLGAANLTAAIALLTKIVLFSKIIPFPVRERLRQMSG